MNLEEIDRRLGIVWKRWNLGAPEVLAAFRELVLTNKYELYGDEVLGREG